MQNDILDKYERLLEQCVNGDIPVSDFAQSFMQMFKDETGALSGSQFLILDELFAAADFFCDSPELFEPGDLGPEELRDRCKVALAQLKQSRV